MNVGNLRVVLATIGSVAAVRLKNSGFRHENQIVLVGNSIARLIVNCFRGHFQIDISKLIYIKCSGPHDDSIKETLNPPEKQKENLGRKNWVELDLINNSILITQSELARTPLTTGPQAQHW